jgi:hypothetical protein
MPSARSLLAGTAAVGFDRLRWLAGSPQRYILVLSHMRSGSSLLHHLLQSNRLVLGAGESNRAYRTAGDLRRLALWVHAERGALLRWPAYVTDQINHTEKLPDMALLQRADVKTVILTREPRASIASIIKLTREFYGSAWSSSQAIEYYLARIATLRRFAAALAASPGSTAFFLTYEELTSNSTSVLAALQAHLRLAEPFSTTYQTFDFTGRRGDPSARVSAQRILAPDTHADFLLPTDQAEHVETQYQLGLASLRSTCATTAQD